MRLYRRRSFEKVGLKVSVTTSTEIELTFSDDMAEVLANHLEKAIEAYKKTADFEGCPDLENLLATLDESVRS